MTSDADAKAFCATHGIHTNLIVDNHGEPQTVVDETGMRQLADLAPNPAQAHALVDQLLAAATSVTITDAEVNELSQHVLDDLKDSGLLD